jgi:hypothetical protein
LGRFITPDWSATPVPIPYADLANPQSLNQYAYVGGNPASKADPDGHCCDLGDVIDFTVGVINAWGTDNAAGVGRVNDGSLAYHLGQVVGDGGAVIQGTAEVATGGVGLVGGTSLIGTGVGAPAGVAIDAGSAALVVHGGATGLTGAANLGKAIVTAFSGKRQGEFTPSEHEEAIQQNADKNGGTNKCERCGQDIQRTQNKKGETPPKNQLQVHHDPAIKNGGGRHSKREVVCRECHQEIHHPKQGKEQN